MRDSRIIAVEDLCELFQSGTPSFHVEEVNEQELNENPDRVDQR